MVPLKALAEELGMDRSHLRRFVLSLGIEPERIRTEDSRNQLTLALSDIDAERVRDERMNDGKLAFRLAVSHSKLCPVVTSTS